jgi:hypothetical protein
MIPFLTLFRVVGNIGSFVFLFWGFTYLLKYPRRVCVGIGLFYLASFLLMCWRVKEGQYPPPDPAARGRGTLQTFALYFREILSFPLYRNYILAYAAFMFASSAGPMGVLFCSETLHLPGSIGKVGAWGGLTSAVLFFPMGYLCKKLAPLRVLFGCLAIFALMNLLSYFLLRGYKSWLVFTLLGQIPWTAYALALTAANMFIFPHQKFAQFSSGMNVLGYGVSLIIGSFLAGQFIDLVHNDYRMIFLWSAFWLTAGLIPMALVFRHYRRHGGPDHYVPPLPPARLTA